jgi:Ca2+/Na+ antiporter
MNSAKKIIGGILFIIFLNVGVSLIFKFFAIDSSVYSDYILWFSFIVIMWMVLPVKNNFTFDNS